MRFIVANYGMRHAGMLLAHLHSIARTHPQAKVAVYWQDIAPPIIGAIRAAFPAVDFIETAYDFAAEPLQRISSKVLCWTRAAEEHTGDLIFADSDTLVRRDLSGFFAGGDDVVFTTKPTERVPLNTGVLLAKGGAATVAFFHAWRDATLHILRTPELFSQANDQALPYGGADQMALIQLLQFQPQREHYTVSAGGQEVRLRAEPCARLNETNSRPLSGVGEEIHIIHYKAGWQSILLFGRPFSRYRPRVASWEMLVYFMETFFAALARANAASGGNFTARDFRIQSLWYYRGGRFLWPGYVAWRAKEAAKRAWLIVTGRLKTGQ